MVVTSLMTFSFFLLLSSILQQYHFVIGASNQKPSISIDALKSSYVYPIKGNVYPDGIFTVAVNIGNPPKPYHLDIDTGSDFSWIQCVPSMPKHRIYKPHGNIVRCSDPMCAEVPSTKKHECHDPSAQCVYEVKYADDGLSSGVLVRDNMVLGRTQGTTINPLVAFGCATELKFSPSNPPPSTSGVLGLGNGKPSILSQLHTLGFIRKVLGHCLSARGGGYFFLGDKFVPSSGIIWTPIIQSSTKHYTTGPADLLFDGNPTLVKGLPLVFDSGCTYTYFNSMVYNDVVNLVLANLKGKPLIRTIADDTLTFCWKGLKPFKSLDDVKSFFKPLTMSFTKSKNLQFELPLVAYLIISQHGNVCLGILNGTEAGLGNQNVIGDISMHDKLVIYDNEKQQIGWTTADCNQLPHS